MALIICLAAFNLIRMVLYLAGARVYMIRQHRPGQGCLWRRGAGHRIAYQPTVSLVVPMHNEGPIDIERDPGTPDEGGLRAAADHRGGRRVDRRHRSSGSACGRSTSTITNAVIEAFTQTNGGKADEMNTAIRTRATGELIMCLDGDSILGAGRGVTKPSRILKSERVVATASNVNIMPNGTDSRAGAALRVPDLPPDEEGPERLQR